MPKRTEQHMTMRRQQILDAAVRVFADKGVHQASMRDICVESGLSMGAVYNHFANKQQLIFSYAERSIDARQPMSFDTLADFKAFIVDFLCDDTEASTANARIEFQIFDEGLRDDVIRSIAARGAENAIKIFRDCLQNLSERGEIRPELNLDVSARKLAGLMVAIAMFILLGVGPTREDSIACLEDEFDHMRISDQ